MEYMDGKPVLVGDKVDLGGGLTGIVVAVIDVGEYSSGYDAEEWRYLSVGALVESTEGGLIHCPESGTSLKLIERLQSLTQ